ncbi:hypothetical protein HDU84_002872 [Entophlyctis sp. JEL0112]|nr:hypothetical protein HDU84_002872 [Entophlyctis sp. JEL0112]
MHLDPRGSPLLPPSPSRDQQQFAMLEDKFCKDFSCCGTILENMHDLLQHYEEYHSRFEAGEDEFDSDEDDEDGFDVLGDDEYDHLPFGFDAMDNDMDMDMDEFDVISAQQQQEFNTAFLRAQIAAMTTNDHQQSLVMSQFPDASLFARTPPTIISRATVSSVLGAGTPLFNPNSTSHFSLIQKHDNQVDDFRIIASQQQQLPSLHMTPTQQISIHSEILLPSGNLDTTPSRHLNNNARGVLDPVTTAPKPTGLDLTETAPVVTPSKVGSMGDDPGGPLAFSANCDFANNSSRPFKCRVRRCGKEYKNANGLKYHMKNVHPVEEIVEIDANAACDKPYMCTADDCGKRYKNLNGLKARNGKNSFQEFNFIMSPFKLSSKTRLSVHTIAFLTLAVTIVVGLVAIKWGSVQKVQALTVEGDEAAANKSTLVSSFIDNGSVAKTTGQTPLACSEQGLDIVNVYIEVYGVQYSSSLIQLSTGFVPCGSFVAEFDAFDSFLSQDISLSVDTTTFTFSANHTMFNQTSTVYLEGDANDYPLDVFSVSFNVRGFYGASRTPLPISVNMFGNPSGYALSFDAQALHDNTAAGVSVSARRSVTVVAFALLIMMLMWLMSLLGAAVAYATWMLPGAKLELPYIIFTVALLFAIPTIRNAMPNAPSIGVLMDQMCTGWALLLLSLAVVAHFVNLLLRLFSETKAAEKAATAPVVEVAQQMGFDKENNPLFNPSLESPAQVLQFSRVTNAPYRTLS